MSQSDLVATLDRFVQASRRQGNPVVDHLRPGLAHTKIESTIQSLGLEAPPELLAVFAWCNGVDHSSLQPGQLPTLTPTATRPFPLDRAIEEYRRTTGDPADTDRYRPAWFPVMGYTHAATIFLDTSRVDDQGRSPIAHFDFQYGWHQEVASLAVPINWWTEYLDKGVWRYGPNGWDDSLKPSETPPERVATGLVF
jgi:hypothetical protein